MPTYNYKCKKCEGTFPVVHSIKSLWTTCLLCDSTEIKKVVTAFSANTETSVEAQQRHHEKQFEKDLDRFQKDDNFAANITGADDSGSAARTQAIIDKEAAKRKQQQAKIKRPGWGWKK